MLGQRDVEIGAVGPRLAAAHDLDARSGHHLFFTHYSSHVCSYLSLTSGPWQKGVKTPLSTLLASFSPVVRSEEIEKEKERKKKDQHIPPSRVQNPFFEIPFVSNTIIFLAACPDPQQFPTRALHRPSPPDDPSAQPPPPDDADSSSPSRARA